MKINPDAIVGKPLVVYIDGTRHQIGTITNAKVVDGKLFVASSIGALTAVPERTAR